MIEIIFFTSNPVKLAHARHLCRAYDVTISGFREKTFRANYDEPRIYDRNTLLRASFFDALTRWKKAFRNWNSRYFIIEDTSVIIDALSTPEIEIPGVDVKFWMKTIKFCHLDQQLKERENNRKARVRSDLLLFSPTFSEINDTNHTPSFQHFSSYTDGNIVDQEFYINTNPTYPWLDNKTFNKWFSPAEKMPISLLPIKEADKYDFRAKAFVDMLAFLENLGVIHKKKNDTIPHQQDLFSIHAPIIIVCGATCAGKSTLAEFLVRNYDYYHLEASDFMHISFYERHGVDSNLSIGSFAEHALTEIPEIVSTQIIKHLNDHPEAALIPKVITGFRSLKEISWLQENGIPNPELIYIDASPETRFNRSKLRRRNDDHPSYELFIKKDNQQKNMGIFELSSSSYFKHIDNEEDLQKFYAIFLDTIPIQKGLPLKLTHRKLENRILLALLKEYNSNESFTTTEISKLVNSNLSSNQKAINKNNVSRYFNQTFYPYYQVTVSEGINHYRLSNTGYSRAILLQKLERLSPNMY